MADDTTQTPPRYASETLLRVTEPEDAEDRLMQPGHAEVVVLRPAPTSIRTGHRSARGRS